MAMLIIWFVASFGLYLLREYVFWYSKKHNDFDKADCKKKLSYKIFLAPYAVILWPAIMYYLLYMPIPETTLYGRARISMMVDGMPVVIEREYACESKPIHGWEPGIYFSRAPVRYIPTIYRVSKTLESKVHVMAAYTPPWWCSGDLNYVKRSRVSPLKQIGQITTLDSDKLSVALASNFYDTSKVEVHEGNVVFSHPLSRVQDVSITIEGIKKPKHIDRDDEDAWFFPKWYKGSRDTKTVVSYYVYEIPKENWANNKEIIELLKTNKTPFYLEGDLIRKICLFRINERGRCGEKQIYPLYPVKIENNTVVVRQPERRPYIAVDFQKKSLKFIRKDKRTFLQIEHEGHLFEVRSSSAEIWALPNSRKLYALKRFRFRTPKKK